MDYEKKYKAALNWMKDVYPTLEGAAKEDAEHYFPELIESEDEKIRKGIIDFLWKEKIFLQEAHSLVESNPKYRFVMDAIAWLEKQGNLVKYYEDKLDRCACDNFNKGYKKALEHQGEKGTNGNNEEIPNSDWSEEDKKNLKVVTDVFGQYGVHLLNYPAFIHWLKTLPNRITLNPYWKPSDEQLKLLREVQQALLGKDCHNRFVNFMYELKRLREE